MSVTLQPIPFVWFYTYTYTYTVRGLVVGPLTIRLLQRHVAKLRRRLHFVISLMHVSVVDAFADFISLHSVWAGIYLFLHFLVLSGIKCFLVLHADRNNVR